jgi:amidophosphoribosyltransferase
MDLAARKAIKAIEGDAGKNLQDYGDASTDRYAAMIENIREQMGLTSLRYQKLSDMIEAVGMPREKLCTYCWNGESLYE